MYLFGNGHQYCKSPLGNGRHEYVSAKELGTSNGVAKPLSQWEKFFQAPTLMKAMTCSLELFMTLRRNG